MQTEASNGGGRVRNRPLFAALLQAIVVGGTALTGIALLSFHSQRILLEDLRRSLGQIATTTAALIDADTHQRIVAAGRAAPSEYEAAAKPLRVLLKSNPDLRFAYTAIIRDDTMYYVLDADPKDDPSVILEVNRDPPLPGQREVVQSQTLNVEQEPNANSWGIGLRAYAPIRDRRGRMIAFLGVTMRAERYAATIREIRSVTLLGSGIATFLALTSGIVAWRMQRARNHALEAAWAASNAKSQFLATMSHEIRTPLNGVLGMNELLVGSSLTAQQFGWADAVRISGRHLLVVINDILDFSKIESGQMELEAVPFDLRDVVEDALAMCGHAAASKGLEIAAQFDSSDNFLLGDPFRLRQVLVNLLGNAIKFTERGEVVVRVKQLEHAGPGARMQLSVQDTGIGIAPLAQERIFDHFSQADGSTTREHGGSGLGLAICRKLLGLMGGSIGVTSVLGEGATFVVDVVLPPADRPARHAPATADLDGVRVLVVDDNRTNREILRQQLSGWGMQVSCAAGGEQALTLLAQAVQADAAYQLAVLDMHMPDMDGLALARAMQRVPALADLPRVMLTSADTGIDTQALQRAGISRHLSKPVRRADLLRLINSALTAEVPESAGPVSSATSAGLRGKVLLVEDNFINQAVSQAMLEKLGLQLQIANNGREAVERVRQHHFDLVLMDCQMPVMDGYEATAAIRGLPAGRGAALPIVALTANAMQGDRQKCLGAGMDGFLAKPYTLPELRATLRSWLPEIEEPAPVTAVTSIENAPAADLPGGASAVNETTLRALQKLDESEDGGFASGLVGDLLRAFLGAAPAQWGQVEAAVQAGDGEALRRAAHGLKSSTGNLGAEGLSAHYRELEGYGSAGAVAAARAALPAVLREHGRVVQRMYELLGVLA
jgi:two-component system, sensor histidine kinase and response regulator